MKGSKCVKPLPLISFELVPRSGERMKCEVKPSKCSEYQVDYRPTRRGRHQLHIKVCDQHIRGSPFTVVALIKLAAPNRTITGLNYPLGVAVDRRGQIIIAQGNCISIYNSGKRIRSFGQDSTAPGQFQYSRGVAVDRASNILIVDQGNHRIQKFTADGKFIASVGSYGHKPLQFCYPTGIGVSPSEKVYICEEYNHRVQILNPDLTFSIGFGSEGSGDGQFQYPQDIAFDSRGNVYVADGGNNRIQVFTEDGRFLRKFGKKGRGDGVLDRPASVAIDSDDVVCVTDANNHRISLFTSEGHFLRSFGTQGKGPGQFNDPRGIAVDKDGLVYVCDGANNRLQILQCYRAPHVIELYTYVLSRDQDSLSGQFQYSWDIAFDSRGNVYVADSGNHRIQVFAEEGRFLRKFGKQGGGDGELNWPASVAIDSNDVVYVSEMDNNHIVATIVCRFCSARALCLM